MRIFHILELTVKVSAYAGHLLGNVVKVDQTGLRDVAGVRQRQLDLVCPSVVHLVALNVQHHQVLYQACAVVLKQYTVLSSDYSDYTQYYHLTTVNTQFCHLTTVNTQYCQY